MLKFIVVIGLVAVASAIEIHHGTNGHGHGHGHGHEEEHHAPAKYSFGYSVHDPHTGDIKSHKETRDGHRVEGSYELIDPDGHRRLVKYTADEHHGFNAVVYREPTDIKIPIPEPKKIIIPQHHQQQKVLLQPVVHHTPIHFVNFIKEHHSQNSHHELSQGQSIQHRLYHF